MSTGRTIIRISSIAALALAGHVIWQQAGPVTAPEPSGTSTPAFVADPPDTPPIQPAMPFVADRASGVALPTQAPSAPAVTVAATPSEPLSPFGLPCGLSVHSEALPGALVALDIMAPCRPDMRVEIEHAGLTFAAATDRAGLLTMDVPALETPAIFTIRLGDGEEDVTIAGMPDLIDIGRVAISWQGDLGIELHAFENGAEFGAPGHVWQGAPGSAADAAIGTGGFHSRLGDASIDRPHLAQVYSYPRTARAAPRLSVDIPVTAETCGRPVRASSHQATAEGRVVSQPIALVLPACDAIGDYLVLQNLFDGLRLASN
ncbi:hypothetical protein HKCCSP123_05890 [Rhodobacterales bacterium HKCCSP123]|nr:hypothetical protein [Rhodobacterales bacterium HKCCSP123]